MSTDKITSDGSTASYYELPKGASELQHLISDKDMNAQLGEIFRACYRYGQASHSDKRRDIKKILFYAQAELDRLERLEKVDREADLAERTEEASFTPVPASAPNTNFMTLPQALQASENKALKDSLKKAYKLMEEYKCNHTLSGRAYEDFCVMQRVVGRAAVIK